MKSNEEILSNPKIWNASNFLGMNTAMLKLQVCGSCTVVWSDNEGGYEHVSISPTHRFRVPCWDDMCELKDMFFDAEEEAYQIMPKKSKYVNIQENCLHLWRPNNGKTLDDLVGGK